jgi:hypothetical protein
MEKRDERGSLDQPIKSPRFLLKIAQMRGRAA